MFSIPASNSFSLWAVSKYTISIAATKATIAKAIEISVLRSFLFHSTNSR
jgi:hypothetical protein